MHDAELQGSTCFRAFRAFGTMATARHRDPAVGHLPDANAERELAQRGISLWQTTPNRAVWVVMAPKRQLPHLDSNQEHSD